MRTTEREGQRKRDRERETEIETHTYRHTESVCAKDVRMINSQKRIRGF